jgi:hypothetical protein
MLETLPREQESGRDYDPDFPNKWYEMEQAVQSGFSGMDMNPEWDGWQRTFDLLHEGRKVMVMTAELNQMVKMRELAVKDRQDVIEWAEESEWRGADGSPVPFAPCC